jgi:hypothetical protein
VRRVAPREEKATISTHWDDGAVGASGYCRESGLPGSLADAGGLSRRLQSRETGEWSGSRSMTGVWDNCRDGDAKEGSGTPTKSLPAAVASRGFPVSVGAVVGHYFTAFDGLHRQANGNPERSRERPKGDRTKRHHNWPDDLQGTPRRIRPG